MENVRSEIEDTNDIIKEATGLTATKFRASGGYGTYANNIDPEVDKVLKDNKMVPKNWDVDTGDSRKGQNGIPASAYPDIKTQLMRHKGSNEITILMHVKPGTARDLPDFIKQLKNWGEPTRTLVVNRGSAEFNINIPRQGVSLLTMDK